jgi:hypothetical protein
MATYYVRPDGNNSNTGTGPATNQAWQTLARIVQAGTAFTSGDTVYIAPGTYRQSITTTATYTSATNFFGDPTAAQFPGVTPGMVRITNFLTNDNSAATSQNLWGGVTFNYINISNIYFDHSSLGYGIVYTGTGNNSSIRNCIFSGNNSSQGGIGANISLVSVKNTLIENCIIMRSYSGIYITTTTDTDTNVDIRNCFFTATNTYQAIISTGTGGGVNVTNNIFYFAGAQAVIFFGSGNGTSKTYVTNNIFYQCVGSVAGDSSVNIIEDYNRRINSGGNSTVLVGLNTVTSGAPQFDFGHTSLFGLALQKPFSSINGSVNVGAGLSTYASTTDLYGQTWSAGASLPDIGCAAAVQASGTSYYYPTDRNESSVQITAGSTSRSLYLYLGATGLTATTTGLEAYYTKEDAAPVSIPLVAQTTTGAWISGGFAEVSAANQPGVYRLDIPNAAISAGYTQTVVTVRGASGTNGAVVVIQEPPILGSQVRMGPFTVQADGVLTDERLKLFKGSIHSIDFKMVDQYGTGVDGTGTVVTANAYNSAGFLVDSYPCTAKYAEDGRYSFAIDATVTNVVGMYTINISRQIGSEINVFGRMKLEVLSP